MHRYLMDLLTPFFAWWWAVLTGVASLVAFASIPDHIKVSRAVVLVLTLAFFLLTFLTFSVLAQAYRWHRRFSAEPAVLRVQRATQQHPLTFVLRPNNAETTPGTVLAVYTTPSTGVEICVALIRVTSEETAANDILAEPLWLLRSHQADLLTGRSPPTSLRLTRILDDRAVRLLRTEDAHYDHQSAS